MTMFANGLVLELLVKGQEKKAQKLAKAISDYVASRIPCPNCEHDDKIDPNPAEEGEFVCQRCGEHFIARVLSNGEFSYQAE